MEEIVEAGSFPSMMVGLEKVRLVFPVSYYRGVEVVLFLIPLTKRNTTLCGFRRLY